MTYDPKKKHPRGHCWNVMQHSNDPMKSIDRLETKAQCREWLGKLNEMDVASEYKEAVAQRYRELQE